MEILNLFQSLGTQFSFNVKWTEWENAVPGAILGSIFSYFIPQIWLFLKNILKDEYKTYYGSYYTYNWAVASTQAISEKKLIISRNIFGFPKVTITINEHVTLHYFGKMRTNGKSLYFDFFGREHAEELKIVFNEPLEKRINLLIGVFSAITLDLAPFSGKIVLSKKRLNLESAKKYLGSRNLIIIDSKHQRNESVYKEIEEKEIINKNL